MKFDIIRPSTIARVIEDAIIGTVAATGRHAVGIKRAIAVEYRARQVVNLQEDIEQAAAKIAAMTPAQRKRFAADQQAVGERIAELMDKQHAREERRAERFVRRAKGKRA